MLLLQSRYRSLQRAARRDACGRGLSHTSSRLGGTLKTLALTSPLTVGPDVIAAQQLLKSGGILQTDLLRGPVDGHFGPATGRACIRAKYRLGYPEDELDPIYGDKLHGFLGGAVRPITYMRRAKARTDAATAQPRRVKALAWLTGHLGDKENPAGSNRVVWASEWYGIIGPWCAMGVTRAYYETGSKAFVKGSRYAYCPFIYHDARYGANGLQIVADPLPGDLVLYDWQGNGVADHVGLFEKWADKRDGIFNAIEGNTAIGNDSNGGEVMRRSRTRKQVQAFVRVGR